MKPFAKLANRDAFSLVEVTVAIGITAFALTAIVSLFSVMFQTEGNVITRTLMPSITSSIIHDVKIALESTTPISEKTFYFSNSGEALDGAKDAAYSCTVMQLRRLDTNGDTTGLPGSATKVSLFRMELRRANATPVLKTAYATVRHQ